MPTALISLVDVDRQWFLSRVGLDVCETSRDAAFCGHTLLSRETMVVEDTHSDPRFADNPLVLGEPHIRFYAGALIRDSIGLPLGTLCLIDQTPRRFGAEDERRLIVLAELVRDELVPDTASAASRARSQLTASVDPLTKLRWQRAFYDAVDEHIAQHGGAATRFVAVSVSNLTYLSSVFGRPVGDEILIEVTNRLELACRAHSRIRLGRLSGRRFGVFLSKGPAGSSSVELESRLVSLLGRPVDTDAGALSPDIHIGVADGDAGVTSCKDGIERCYVALAGATETRGVVSAVFQAHHRESLHREHRIAGELKRALGNDSLEMFYQPKVDAVNEGIAGFEALLRWDHLELGQVRPMEIMRAAERINFIHGVDHWTVRRTLRQLAKWRALGLDYGRVSVNIVGATLTTPGFCDWLQATLEEFDTPQYHLDLEIVESSVFDDFEAVVGVMQDVVALGVTFSLDDFGTGHSSLAYLRRLPVATLKIDRSFVAGMLDHPRDAALCSGIIAIARDLGLITVAEGVETVAQCEVLRSYLCDQLQGYHFAKPMSPGAATKYLQRGGV